MIFFARDTTSRNLSINTLPQNLDQILTLPLFIRSTFSDTLTLSVSTFENLPSNWSLSIVKPLSDEYLMLFAKSVKGEELAIMDIHLDAKESIRVPLGITTSFEGDVKFSISNNERMPDGWNAAIYNESKGME